MKLSWDGFKWLTQLGFFQRPRACLVGSLGEGKRKKNLGAVALGMLLGQEPANGEM